VIGQRALVALALAAGALAGVLYYAGTQRTSVVVAARDLDAVHALVADDLTTAALPPDAVPPGAIGDVASAIGRTPRAPLQRGQVLLAGGIAEGPAAFHTGLALPPAMRAIALPVGPAQAVGGAIVPGASVDVLAVPVAGRAPAGRTTELLAQGALVLDVRADTGVAFGASGRSAVTALTDRIGSVVVAIDRAEEIRFADRIATSTFVLALASSK
jgi:Flp pilus assembly protein CpaB